MVLLILGIFLLIFLIIYIIKFTHSYNFILIDFIFIYCSLCLSFPAIFSGYHDFIELNNYSVLNHPKLIQVLSNSEENLYITVVKDEEKEYVLLLKPNQLSLYRKDSFVMTRSDFKSSYFKELSESESEE